MMEVIKVFEELTSQPIDSNYQIKPTTQWPEPLAQEAFHGLAGEIVRIIEPHSEADPAALLFTFLTLFGNVIGRNSYAQVESDRHYGNLFVCLVGKSAKARKGTSYGRIIRLFEGVDETWTKTRVIAGLSSGEGAIWAVRDEVKQIQYDKKTKEYDEIVLDPGIDDKRLLCDEAEFASVIRVLRREGNVLSAIIRKAWDGGILSTLTKNSPARATNAHISILGHITRDELTKHMADVDAANGFANRFCWVCVQRSKLLPEGGKLRESDLMDVTNRLCGIVEFAKQPRELQRDRRATELWRAVYPELSEGKPGLLGSMTARGEAQVLRLSVLYALLDASEVIRVEHLTAALACWEYCEGSARYVFGHSLGDPLVDDVLKLLKEAGETGLTRTNLFNAFSNNAKGETIAKALSKLYDYGLAVYHKDHHSDGRPTERWFYKQIKGT